MYSSVEEDDSHPRAVQAKLVGEVCTISPELPHASGCRHLTQSHAHGLTPRQQLILRIFAQVCNCAKLFLELVSAADKANWPHIPAQRLESSTLPTVDASGILLMVPSLRPFPELAASSGATTTRHLQSRSCIKELPAVRAPIMPSDAAQSSIPSALPCRASIFLRNLEGPETCGLRKAF